ncbi:MAG: hypothetical protein AAF633_27580 [Chloroflexota bacterium]
MSTYTIEEILQKWNLEEITAEQAIGHLLQNIQRLSDRTSLVERRVDKLYRERREEIRKTQSKSKGVDSGVVSGLGK